MGKLLTLCTLSAIVQSALGFVSPIKSSVGVHYQFKGGRISKACMYERVSRNDHQDANDAVVLSRRSLLSFVGQTALVVTITNANADDSNGKVVVFGGSGWVGAHVGQILSKQGVEVVSVSRSSPPDQAEKVKKILGVDLPIEYRSIDASKDDLTEVLKGASAVVSLVGVAPGGKNQRDGNGAVNVRIADAAKAAGIGRFVYVSVSSELSNGPAKFLLGDYFKGKAEAESAVVKDFGATYSLVIKPAIIAGGPPGEIRPPGPPGITPVTVDKVAEVVVAGALGRFSGSIDGNNAISASVK